MAFIALVLAWPVLVTFLQTGLVPRLPTAVLSTGLMLLAFLSLTCGLILETVTRGRREIKRMQYLRIPAPGVPDACTHPRDTARHRDRQMIRRLFSAELIKFGIVGVSRARRRYRRAVPLPRHQRAWPVLIPRGVVSGRRDDDLGA